MRWSKPLAIVVALGLLLSLPQVAAADNIGGAADISNPPGGFRGDVATAALLSRARNGIGLVQTYGDNQYENGEYLNFLIAYERSWGRYKSITRPAPGNHEYLVPGTGQTMTAEQVAQVPGGLGYYRYFAGRTPPHPGYYSYDYQGWHFVVLNTTCSVVPGGCTGAQLTWLKADLAANRSKRCTVVTGHHPYFASASPFYGAPSLRAIWPTLVVEDVDLYIAGHNHSYERLKPMRTQGNVDTDWGPGDGDDGHAGVPIVVVGTGGRSLIPFTRIHPNSLVRFNRYGILKIVPNYPAAGQWIQAFKGTDGGTYDRVAFRCH